MIYASKNLTYSIIFFMNFLDGIQHAVILPTALQYINKFHGGQFEFGLCLSAFSFSSLFSSPLMGKWYDVYKNTKRIMLFANTWQVVGSFMYFTGVSSYFLIFGRLVCGVGLGVNGCCFGDIVKTTTTKERSGVFSKIMLGRQVGLIVGPAFNVMLYNLDFNIGPFHVDKLSGPGLLMCCSWIIVQILVIFFYKNLPEFKNLDTEPTVYQKTPNESTPMMKENSNKFYRSISDSEIDKSKSIEENDEDFSKINFVSKPNDITLSKRLFDEYIREEVVAVLCSTFCVFVMLTTFNTFIIPFTEEYFGWTEIQISVYFGISGFVIAVFYLIHSFVSKKVYDKYLLLLGLVVNLSVCIILFAHLSTYKKVKNPDPTKIALKDYIIFMGSTFCATVFSLPLIVVSSISLLSKITSVKNQGLTQGIRRTFVDIACIVGPLWAGTFYKQWSILFGTLIFILGISLVMIVLSFKNINEKLNEKLNESLSFNSSNESNASKA